MVNTEITFIIFFSAEDGEALVSQPKRKKKVLELTVAQIMRSLLQNSGFFFPEESRENH